MMMNHTPLPYGQHDRAPRTQIIQNSAYCSDEAERGEGRKYYSDYPIYIKMLEFKLEVTKITLG